MAEIGTEEEFASQTSWERASQTVAWGNLSLKSLLAPSLRGRKEQREMGLEGHRIRLPRAGHAFQRIVGFIQRTMRSHLGF